MSISIEPPEVLAERWAAGCDRYVRETLASGETHARITQAVSFSSPCVRTVSRRAGKVVQVALPGWVLEKLGVASGGFVVFELTEHDTVELRRLTDQDLDDLARAAVARASRLLPAREAWRAPKHFEKRCEQCGEPYLANRAFQKFCPSCGEARAKAARRAWWQAQREDRASAAQTAAGEGGRLR